MMKIIRFEEKWMRFAILIALCLILVGVSPVLAASNSILPLAPEQTVFLGEQNVTLTGFPSYQVAWFNDTSVNPVVIETLNSPVDSFDSYHHAGFNASTYGIWYFWNGTAKSTVAFILADPEMDVRVVDSNKTTCEGWDRTGKTVMYPLNLDFKTSLIPDVTNRGPITYDVNMSDGTTGYPCVNGECGGSDPETPVHLINQVMAATPAYIGPWLTGALDAVNQYFTPPGTYSFRSVCEINGLTITSPTETVTLAKPSVDIAVSPSTMERGRKATVTITGQPATSYYFAIVECPLKMTGEACDKPPWIVENSSITGTLTFDDSRIGAQNMVPSCCGGLPFKSVVPALAHDGHYYARVTTDCNGTASFLVESDAETWKASGDPAYTLHVQKVEKEDDGTTLYDQTTLTLTKGAISITFYDASDEAQTPITEAYLGDFIGIKGANSESATTYLYMTGPCQPACGGGLVPDPYPYGLIGKDPYTVNVTGGSWVFVNPYDETYWDTRFLPMNPGTYTIYALSDWPGKCPDCVSCGGGTCKLLNCPNCLIYAVGTITLKAPTLTANVSDIERCCCPGYPCGTTIDRHPIYVTGTAAGNTHINLTSGETTKDVNVWLFGKGKIGDHKFLNWKETVPCDGDFNFTVNLSRWDIPLCSLDAGTYDLVIQTRGYNQEFDVLYEDDILGTALSQGVPVELNKRWIVTSYPVNALQDLTNGEFPDYAKLVQVEGPGYKMGTEVLQALIKALDDPNIDDEFAHAQFTVKDKSCLGGANFEADRTYGNNPLKVRFTDTSSNASSWAWDFGDGNSSAEENPIHTYTAEGRYTVSLTINGDDSTKAVKNDYIRVAKGPSADFTFAPEDVTVGDEIQFTDLSTGNPTSWIWHFGDGSSSPLQSPVYTYTTPGVYTVSLTVSDEIGISSAAKEKTITVQGSSTPVVAEFGTDVFSGTTVVFTDMSTGFGINSWSWNFGDGSTSTEQNPTHVYNKEGTYVVSLTVSNGNYENTASKTIGIR